MGICLNHIYFRPKISAACLKMSFSIYSCWFSLRSRINSSCSGVRLSFSWKEPVFSACFTHLSNRDVAISYSRQISHLRFPARYKSTSCCLNSSVYLRGSIIEETKTEAGKRKIPITEDVAQMFQAVIEDREPLKMEKVIDGHTGFLFYDDDGNPLVAMHWQHRFNRMVGRYNDIYRVQMPNITPHVCRHTYCSNMAKSGMNPKTLQYLMGHSDISVTMNVYTHISF